KGSVPFFRLQLITPWPFVVAAQGVGEALGDASLVALLPQRHDDELAARGVVAADEDEFAVGDVAHEHRPALAGLDAPRGPRLPDAAGDLGAGIEPTRDALPVALDRVLGDRDQDGGPAHDSSFR